MVDYTINNTGGTQGCLVETSDAADDVERASFGGLGVGEKKRGSFTSTTRNGNAPEI